MDRKIYFSYHASEEILEGRLFYISNDYALNYEISQEAKKNVGSISSLSFDTLEIFINLNSRILLYPHGYFPITSWIEKKLPQLTTIKAKVYIKSSLDMAAGIAIEYLKFHNWKRLYDSSTGWIYYGPSAINICDTNVEFANNSIISLLNGEIYSLWFKPIFK